MKKLALILIVLMTALSSRAQLASGSYTVLTWQIANSKKIITDGVFPKETGATITVDEDFIILSFSGYISAMFPQGDWKEQDDYFYCSTSTYKERTLVTLMLEPVENVEGSWTLTIYYNENHIERFGFYKNK